MEPDNTSFDYENKSKEKHKNRILLEAEPQIGKTGVYLRVIFFRNFNFQDRFVSTGLADKINFTDFLTGSNKCELMTGGFNVKYPLVNSFYNLFS